MGKVETKGRGSSGEKLETLLNYVGWAAIAGFFVGLIFLLDMAFL
ncbi:hypothetical protein [Mesorhizobium sp. A556]